ncbi:EKC/KEOPS complex subunit TP53RK isoform X2 [Ischnura elegans]|nr:EKC/KEOPS complex subunit TP53RK isoform X2 [Ischnura elegans]
MEILPECKLLKQGAEAKIYVGDFMGRSAVLKERFVKKYRHPVLDDRITKDRIKAETRAIMKCKAAGISTPALYMVDIVKRFILMEKIAGITVKEYIKTMEEEFQNSSEREAIQTKLKHLGNDIGMMVGCLHASSIVHGDLTSSNILMRGDQLHENDVGDGDKLCGKVVPRSGWQRLVLIDFGLSRTDPNTEDKGVDIYVLERALLSTHPHVAEDIIFPAFLEGYIRKGGKSSKDVLAKYEEVRMRGRKRTMVG